MLDSKPIRRAVIVLAALVAMTGCGDDATSDPYVDGTGDSEAADVLAPLSTPDREALAKSGGTSCDATVASAAALPPGQTGFSCTDAECTAAFPSGGTVTLTCEDGSCPADPGGPGKSIRCDDGPVAKRCRVTFSQITRQCS